MKDAYYFSHDSNAKDDPKCMELIDSLGLEGYGIFWVLIELLRDQPEYSYPTRLIPALAKKYNTSADKVSAVICHFGLFQSDNDCFWSESLIRRMGRRDEIRQLRSDAGKASGKSRQRLLTDGTDVEHVLNKKGTDVEHVLNKNEQGKERKEKERKGKKRKGKERIAGNGNWLLLLQNYFYYFTPTDNWIDMIERSWQDIDLYTLCQEFVSFWDNKQPKDIESKIIDSLQHARDNGKFQRKNKGMYDHIVQR